jgi:hypothetical protein
MKTSALVSFKQTIWSQMLGSDKTEMYYYYSQPFISSSLSSSHPFSIQAGVGLVSNLQTPRADTTYGVVVWMLKARVEYVL